MYYFLYGFLYLLSLLPMRLLYILSDGIYFLLYYVFGYRRKVVKALAKGSSVPDWDAGGTREPKEMILITQSLKELQQVMSDYVGIVRTNVRLGRAMKRIDLLWEETETLYQTSTLSPQLCELRNMITVGYLIIKCAQFRHESRGLHFNTDYPGKSDIVQNIVL